MSNHGKAKLLCPKDLNLRGGHITFLMKVGWMETPIDLHIELLSEVKVVKSLSRILSFAS